MKVLLSLFLAVSSAAVASASSFEALTARRSLQLRELLQASPQEDSSPEDQARLLFDSATREKFIDASSAKKVASSLMTSAGRDNQERRSRRLDGHCGVFDEVLLANCTLTEFCDVLDAQFDEVDIECDGDPFADWTTLLTGKEFCLYLSQGFQEPAPYNASLFDAGSDFCVQAIFTLGWDSSLPVTVVQTTKFTRGGVGEFSQESDLVECPSPSGEVPLIDGYCSECTGATLGGAQCTSCAPCPSGSFGFVSVDCENVSPGFLTDCDTFDDDLILPTGAFTGAFCSIPAVLSEACTLDRFCSQLEAAFNNDGEGSGTCTTTGAVTGDWGFTLTSSEVCSYNATDFDDEGLYDPARFDASMGHYCYTSTQVFDATGGTFKTQVITQMFTRPMDSVGKVEITYDLLASSDCDDDFLQGFCSDEESCPGLFVGGLECTSGCTNCTDGEVINSCTNLDPSFVATCEEDDDIIMALLAYFKANPQTMAPTSAPTSAPTVSSVAGVHTAGVAMVTSFVVVWALFC